MVPPFFCKKKIIPILYLNIPTNMAFCFPF